jgi:competence protein ComEC
VSELLVPLAAAAFWAGLVVAGTGGWSQRLLAWAALAGGLLMLGLGAWLAPRTASGLGPLERARIAMPEHPVTRAVGAPRRIAGGSGTAVAAFALAGLVLLGAGWGALAAARVDASFLGRLAPMRVRVEGTLREDPVAGTIGWHALLDVRRVQWGSRSVTLHERVWLSGNGDVPEAVRWDAVAAEGILRIPDEGSFAETLRRDGIAAELGADRFRRTGPAPNRLVRAMQSFRVFAGRSIDRIFPPREAGLLLGLALGDASQLDPVTSAGFQATGLGHLLVVSGENVAMVLAPVMAFALWVGLARWGRFALGTITVLSFVVLTGAEPSVLRAGVMASLAMIGVLAGRPRSTGAVLAAAVLVLLVLDPWLVWSIGFQLSVAATAGMVTLATPISARLGRLIPKPVALAASTSIAAQLAVTPVLLYHFHEVPGVTIVANLLAFPAVSPALLLGLAAAVAGIASPSLGHLLALPALVPMRYLEEVATRLAKAPVGWITSSGGPGILVFGGALVVVLGWWLRSGKRLPRPAVVVGIALLPLVVWSTAIGAGPPSGLTIRFLDVGQGDAALVTSPAGATMLVDGGPDQEQVATYLAALGVKRLDVVVASHPHADHIVGLPAVFARFPVGTFIEPGCPDTSDIQDLLEYAVSAEHVPEVHPRAGESFDVGDLRVDVLSPDRCWLGTNSDPNNDSLVLRVRLGGDVALLSMEPEEAAQQVMLDDGVDLHAALLHVPHHGARTSLPAFFQAVGARVAVVSVGPNDYGHPVPATLEAVAATGAQVWRTDQHGTITVTFGGQGPVIASER